MLGKALPQSTCCFVLELQHTPACSCNLTANAPLSAVAALASRGCERRLVSSQADPEAASQTWYHDEYARSEHSGAFWISNLSKSVVQSRLHGRAPTMRPAAGSSVSLLPQMQPRCPRLPERLAALWNRAMYAPATFLTPKLSELLTTMHKVRHCTRHAAATRARQPQRTRSVLRLDACRRYLDIKASSIPRQALAVRLARIDSFNGYRPRSVIQYPAWYIS